MYAVILHDSGRIDARDVSDLQAETLLLWRANKPAARYAVMSLRDTLPGALNAAAEFRKERRDASKVRMLVQGEA